MAHATETLGQCPPAPAAPQVQGEVRRTRVAFFLGDLANGGAERVTSILLSGLDRSRFAPELILVRDNRGYSIPADVPVHCVQHDIRLLPALRSVQTIAWLRSWLRRERPDVVVSMLSHYNLRFGAALASTYPRPAWIARIANKPSFDENRATKVLARRIYGYASLIAANSEGLRSDFMRHYRSPAWSTQVLRNPVDVTLLAAQAEREPEIELPPAPFVVAAGRLCTQKRYDVMLNAFRKVLNQFDAHLVVLGEGHLRAKLEHLAQDLDIGKRVHFAGFVSNPHAIMSRAAAFLLTSDHEGSPNALIEAQALGVPAVATDCEFGPSEIVEDHVTGFLCACGDTAALANCMVDLLRDHALRTKFAEAAKQRVGPRHHPSRALAAWQNAIMSVASTSPQSLASITLIQ